MTTMQDVIAAIRKHKSDDFNADTIWVPGDYTDEFAFLDSWLETQRVFFAHLDSIPEDQHQAAWREAEAHGFEVMG